MAYKPDEQFSAFMGRLIGNISVNETCTKNISELSGEWTNREYGSGSANEITDQMLTDAGYQGITAQNIFDLMANLAALLTALNNCVTNQDKVKR